MFINATRVPLCIRGIDGTLLNIPVTEDKELLDVFNIQSDFVVHDTFEMDQCPAINITGPPEYKLDCSLFNAYFNARSTPDTVTCVLVSTIAGGALLNGDVTCPPNYRFMVPYSGPDPQRCCRSKEGVIAWVSELLDYTPM